MVDVSPDNFSGQVGETARPVLLASASPRRRELLGYLGVRFVVVVSRFDEATLRSLTDPVDYVQKAAYGKASEVARRRDGIILGADTDVVAPDGSILGKPADAEEAHRMLRTLSGQTHLVYSGVSLLQAESGVIQRQETQIVRTEVTFAHLSNEAIAAYVATGEPMDKAGGYGIQGRALAFVASVRGDLSNVIGLPLETVGQMLSRFGVPLWQNRE